LAQTEEAETMAIRGSQRRLVWFGATVLGLVAPLLVASSAGAAGPQVKEPKYGFNFTLPTNWKTVPLNGGDIKSLLNSASHNDPSVASALSAQVKSAVEQGVKVFAIGPETGGSVPNVSIITGSASGSPSGSAFPSTAVTQAKISLTQIGATHIQAAVVKNHMGDTAEVVYQLPLKTGKVEGAQLYVRHKARVVVMTVTTTTQASSVSAARAIVNSWKWTS
jgi:hypothetical protein